MERQAEAPAAARRLTGAGRGGRLGPKRTSQLLDRLYTALDSLSEHHGVYKVKGGGGGGGTCARQRVGTCARQMGTCARQRGDVCKAEGGRVQGRGG